MTRRKILLSMLLLGTSAASQAEHPLFDNPILAPAAGTVVRAVDLDGDGALDVVALVDSDTVGTWLNTGLGQLLRHGDVDSDLSVADFELGDVTGDGHTDLVTLCLFPFIGPQELRVSAGNGEGDFAPAAAVALPEIPGDVALTDLDGDGALDAVVTLPAVGQVGVLLGDGLGGLLPAVTLAVGLDPRDLALGDVDADGLADLVVATSGETALQLLLGDGAGGFGPPASIPVGAAPELVRLADLDLDGQPDLLVARAGVPALELLLAAGPGSFAAPVPHPLPLAAFDVAVGDLDADGLPDLAVGAAHALVVLPALGGGLFAPYQLVPSTHDAYGVALADLGLDGRVDLLAGVGFDGQLVIHTGDGLGGFVEPLSVTSDLGAERTAADLDGDGDVDLVVRIGGAGGLDTVNIVLNDGAGNFSPGASVPAGAALLGRPALADLDLDGQLDVLLPVPGLGELLVVPGDGQGGLATPLAFPAGQLPISVQAGDLDGDGWIDAVVGTSANFSLRVLLNDGAGGLVQDSWYPLGPGVFPRLADLDEDGALDVAAWRANSLHVFLGDGTGGLTEIESHPELAVDDRAVALADIDQDGHVDALSGWWPTGLVIRFGDGSGHFTTSESWSIPGGSGDIELADMDDDGRLDVVAETAATAEGFAILHGTGTRAGQAPRLYDAPVTRRPTAADFDGDGRTDLLLGTTPEIPQLLIQRTPGPWEDLGQSLAGLSGAPRLVGSGSLIGDSPLTLTFSDAAPGSLSLFAASTALLGAPFKGGVFVPDPGAAGVLVTVPTGSGGGYVIEGLWPAAAPSGFAAWVQVWVLDPEGPLGFTASNAVKGTTP